MKKNNLKTQKVQEEDITRKIFLRTNIRITFEIVEEGICKVYNATGKLVDKHFEWILDSRWASNSLAKEDISGTEITQEMLNASLKETADWVNGMITHEIEDDKTTEDNKEVDR